MMSLASGPPPRLPANRFDATAVQELRVWLTARQGRTAVERLELEALVRDAPGNTEALERLAVLATQAGETREAEQLRRRKVNIDRIQHRFKLCRNRNGDPIYCAPFKVEPAADHVFRNDAG
jgi:hypothetical protein